MSDEQPRSSCEWERRMSREVGEITVSVKAVRREIASMRQDNSQDIDELKASVERIQEKLIGNGSDGLCIEVDRLKNWVKHHDQARKREWMFMWTVASGLAVALGKGLWDFFRGTK